MELTDFWQRFPSGVTVAAATDVPAKLLGIRDAFRRYFERNLKWNAAVTVVPQPQNEIATPLPLADSDTLELARRRAHDLEASLGDTYAFCVSSEIGLLSLHCGDELRQLVRCWTVVLGLGDEAWGSSGSVEVPQRLIRGLDQDRIPFAIPGTRRSGGMMASLTGGLEGRRSATELATLNALSTLMYGLYGGPTRLSRPAARLEPR